MQHQHTQHMHGHSNTQIPVNQKRPINPNNPKKQNR